MFLYSMLGISEHYLHAFDLYMFIHHILPLHYDSIPYVYKQI